jgi:hypothetical protein
VGGASANSRPDEQADRPPTPDPSPPRAKARGGRGGHRARLRDLAAHFARGLLLNSRPLQSEGAGNTGCTLHPRSRVQQCTKKRTRAYRFSGGNPAFPAQWFYGLFRALPGEPGFLATVAPEKLASQELDASVGASGPHVFAVRISAVRLSAHPRPPHPAPRP